MFIIMLPPVGPVLKCFVCIVGENRKGLSKERLFIFMIVEEAPESVYKTTRLCAATYTYIFLCFEFLAL